MKHILTVPRSAITSLLLPYIIHCLFAILSFVVLTSAAHSTADPGKDFELNHQHIVEEFKAKVMQHMGWSLPPRGYNASKHSLHGKLIREFFRKRFQAGTHRDSFDSISQDDQIDDLQTVVFPSTDPEVWVEVQPVNTPRSPTTLTSVEFNTNFEQPEVPYHDLLIKSAILRMRINRQKRKLRGKDKSVVNFYLLRKDSNISGDKVTATLLHSRTLDTTRNKFIKINIKPQLLSHILESDEKTVSIGISVVPVVDSADRIGQLFDNSEEITDQSTGQLRKERIILSKATLRVTTMKRDLRKSRTKRQENDNPSCTDMCCRHSIYVNFSDIGWNDWVVYPDGFTAYYCKGGCPDRYRVASSFTGIKSLLHERNPDTVPGPVCAPTDYAPLDMIVYDGDLRDVSYPGMVVTGCRCY